MTAWHEETVDKGASTAEATSPRESSIPRPLPIVESGKHNVFSHISRNCEVCKKDQNSQGSLHWYSDTRAENLGDLIIADHKVLNEECESRNSHRYGDRAGFSHSLVTALSVQN